MGDRFNAVKKVVIVISVLSIFDVVMGFSSPLLSFLEYFSGKSVFRVASDLAFLEGAVIFGVGSFLAFFSSEFGLREALPLLVGALMIGVALVFGLFV
jgi:hypothetical protein